MVGDPGEKMERRERKIGLPGPRTLRQSMSVGFSIFVFTRSL